MKKICAVKHFFCSGASRCTRRGRRGNGPERPRRELDEHSQWTIGCAAGNGDARPGRMPGDGPGTRTGRMTAPPFANIRSVNIRTDVEPRAARNRAVPGTGWVGGGATHTRVSTYVRPGQACRQSAMPLAAGLKRPYQKTGP